MDDQTPEPRKPGRPRKAETLTDGPVTTTEVPGGIPKPRISVLERSIQHPFGIPSSPVELKEPGLVCRWVNTELKGGEQFQYALSHGWLQVKPEYLKTPKLVTFTTSADGYVTRGARGTELLMYTTLSHYRDRQLAKQQANERMLQPGVTKQEVVAAASRELGDEAASYLNQHVGPVGDVRTTHERIQVDPHDE